MISNSLVDFRAWRWRVNSR